MADKKSSKPATGNSGTLALEPVSGMTTIQALHKSLQQALKNAPNLTIDAGKVERITSPAFQLLIAAARSLEEGGGRLTLANPTEPFVQAARDLGLDQTIQQWSTAS